MRLKLSIIGIFFLVAGTSAQYYTRDAGLRLGEGVFITYRQFLNEKTAVEGMAGFSKNGFRVCGLKEYFVPLASARSDNLQLIYGYGIHAGVNYTNKYKLFNRIYYHEWMWSPQFGVDGIIGIDYAASEFPFLISAALHPYFEFSLNRYFLLQPFNIVIALKYRF